MFFRSHANKNPQGSTFRPHFAPPGRLMITSGLFINEQFSSVLNKGEGTRYGEPEPVLLGSRDSSIPPPSVFWKPVTAKDHSALSNAEVRPSLPYLTSLRKSVDSSTCCMKPEIHVTAQDPLLCLEMFLFNEYSPILIDWIKSTTWPVHFVFDEQQYNPSEVSLMQLLLYTGSS